MSETRPSPHATTAEAAAGAARHTATAVHGALAGTLLTTTYAAIELLVSGPFTMSPEESMGSWYIGALFNYVLVYAALGAVTGGIAGFVLGRAGVLRDHVLPALSAVLMVAFVGHAWYVGFGLLRTYFLPLLLPLAAWLLGGPFSRRADAARMFVGSPWPAALMIVGPIALSRGDVVRMGDVGNLTAACLLIATVLGLGLLARVHRGPLRLASWKRQAVLTTVVLLAGFAMMRTAPEEPRAGSERAGPPAKPDIVLITLDTTRADRLSAYGHRWRTTPRLDAFASRATLYRRAYASGDMTLSSHGSLFTGLYPTEHGAHINVDAESAIAPAVPTLGELLRRAGYRTYAVVANPAYLDPAHGFARGFDEWQMPRPLPVVSPTGTTYLLRTGVYKLTLPWLWTEAMRLFVPAGDIASAGEALVADTDSQPFFLFLNFMESHRPWQSSGHFRTLFPGYDQTFDEVALRAVQPQIIGGKRPVSAGEALKMGAAYDGSLAYLDDVVGGMLERLADESWYNDSLIIVTADHGEQLGERNRIAHGNGVDHGVTSIPLIVKFPGQPAGRIVDSPVSQIDVFSTIAATAGATVPANREGVDLRAAELDDERALLMESYPLRMFISDNPKMNRVERAIVKGRWKLITSTRGRRELYDMVSDPTESTDLASRRASLTDELEQLLNEWVGAAEGRRPPPMEPARDQDLLQRLRALGYLQ